MADSPQSTEESISAIGLAVGEIVKQVKQVSAKGVKVEYSQNEDDDNDTDDWAHDEEAYDAAIRQIESIDLTQDDDTSLPVPGGEPTDESLRCDHSDKGIRNPCLCGTHGLVTAIPHPQEDAEVVVGKVYALNTECRVGRYHIDFVEVAQIWEHRRNGTIVIRGFAYARTRNLDGRLQAYQNELCRIIEVDSNDRRPEHEQCLVEVVVTELIPHIRILHQTNKPFPECRFDPAAYPTKEERESRASLTCRWVLAMLYPDKRFRRAQRPVDGECLVHLAEAGVPKKRHRANDSERLRNWRGATHKGGSYNSSPAEGTSNASGKDTLAPRPRYNAADMFSGAGGYTTGATSAGIKVERAVDHWARCNATYKANHPDVELHEVDIMAYCNDLTIPAKHFDLVHISPPCQVFSPAHTCIGKNDPANIAALSACEHIVFLLRPRIVTFEQTFGIIQERHLPLFNALLQSLTKYGYSLEWKVISLVDYGLPQNRKRLIMIGAAPGEALPPFPEPTHVAEPRVGEGKRRFVSAVKACWGLVEGQGMHNPAEVKHMERIQWDGTQPMNRTITTSGGQAYHWEGERDLTLAEFARLQGFPEGYEFKAPCIKKQIGNAFPPIVVTAIMKQLVAWLEAVDGISSGPHEEHIVTIEDDDDPYEYPLYETDDGHEGGGAGLLSHECLSAPPDVDCAGSSEHIEDIDAAFSSPPQRPAPDISSAMEPDLVAMSPEQRAAWVAHYPRRLYMSRRSSSSSSRRRQSSVIYTGERRRRSLFVIVEDDDDENGEGRAGRGGAAVHGSQQNPGQTLASSAQGVPDDDDDEEGESSSSSGNFDPNDIQRFDVGAQDEELIQDETTRRDTASPPTPPNRPPAPRFGEVQQGRDPYDPTYRDGVRTYQLGSGSTRYSARELAYMTEEQLAGVLGMYDDDDDDDHDDGDDDDDDPEPAVDSPPEPVDSAGADGPSASPLGASPPASTEDGLTRGLEERLSRRREGGRDTHDHGHPGSSRGPAEPSSSSSSAGPQTDFSEWQDETIAEAEAMARTLDMSIRDAVERQTQMEEEEARDGKGKGKTVSKRSYAAGANDAETSSPAKKSRTQ